MNKPEFRLGTTSYIIPADILPNVQFLAGKVQDVELVLFEVDDGTNNLPDPQTIQTLFELSQQQDLSYTVHLPLDLRLGSDGDEQHVSLIKAKRVIDCTRSLKPWAYVLHLDGREVRDSSDPLRPALHAELCLAKLCGLSKLRRCDLSEAVFSNGLAVHWPILSISPGAARMAEGHLGMG